MKTKMFPILGTAQPYMENIEGLNLAAVGLTTVQATNLTL
jgi:hypothetical protein